MEFHSKSVQSDIAADRKMEKGGVYRIREKESSFDESKEESISRSRLNPQFRAEMSESERYDVVFWGAVVASQVVGLLIVSLVAYWCVLNGGFAWDSDADLQFNFHPLLMVLGLVFFYGDAMIVYRVLHFVPKWILKIVHGALHIVAIVMSSVGIAAVLENHRRTNKADFYSLHSWIGIATFGFFCVQYVGSFIVYLLPDLSLSAAPSQLPPALLSLRAKLMPFHVFFGIGLFIMAVASTEMGITEKLLYTENYSKFIKQGIVGNCIGLLVVIFAFLIVYITTHATYKRRPLPSESAPPH